MRRALLIVLLSLAYVGCATREPVAVVPDPGASDELPAPSPAPSVTVPKPKPPAPAPEDPGPDKARPEPRHGGEIRVLVSDAEQREALVRGAVAEPLRPGALLRGVSAPEAEGGCWRLELATDRVLPEGGSLRADDVIASWRAALSDEAAWAPHLLLAFDDATQRVRQGQRRLSSLAGVRADRDVLEICPEAPVPRLMERLSQPTLWPWLRSFGSTSRVGSGPFQETADGTLVPNPGYPKPAPYVSHVVPVDLGQGDPPLLFELGDAHLSVVFGGDADALIATADADLAVERLPAWDRTYFLWLNPGKRWINDPKFRRWLSGTVDRDEMVRFLFSGRGTRAYSLRPDGPAYPLYDVEAERPLSPTSVPRLSLVFDATDRHATTVARRLKAVLDTVDVDMSLRPLAPADLRRAFENQEVEVALLAHHPSTEDPVLALLGTLWWFGEPAQESLLDLLRADRASDPARRADAARDAEQNLLRETRLVPLIRLEAWLARHAKLTGVAAPRDGIIDLGRAWWLP